jgi:hypothetical protein
MKGNCMVLRLGLKQKIMKRGYLPERLKGHLLTGKQPNAGAQQPTVNVSHRISYIALLSNSQNLLTECLKIPLNAIEHRSRNHLITVDIIKSKMLTPRTRIYSVLSWELSYSFALIM